MNVEVPAANFGRNEDWLLLSRVLGRRIIFRADVINLCKGRTLDFDGHPCNEATAHTSVKCKASDILITEKIFKK